MLKIKTRPGVAAVLRYCLLIMFSLACGLFLVSFTIIGYFRIFPPLSGQLVGFCIVSVLFFLVMGTLMYLLFKKGKTGFALWLMGVTVILMLFGVPLFMVENNHMLWHQDPFGDRGQSSLIVFNPAEVKLLTSAYDLYAFIMGKTGAIALLYIALYLGVALYWWRKGRQARAARR
jgi:hypothetical protein